MYAAILHAVGEPSGTLETDLERRPYVDIETTQYLDDREVHHGTLAGHVEAEQPKFYTSADVDEERTTLHTETTTNDIPVVTEFIGDLEAGWVGVDASDGADLLEGILATQVNCIPEPTELDLAAVVEELPEDVHVKGVVTSEEGDDDLDPGASSALWHADAPRSASGIPSEDLSQVSVRYRWDGHDIDATLAASGYVAVYSEAAAATVARWISEVVWPHTVHGSGAADASVADICPECGTEADDLQRHEAAPTDAPICLVCRDQYDEDTRGPGGEPA